MRLATFVFVVWGVGTTALFGQVPPATLTGEVLDPSGAVIVGARVEVHSGARVLTATTTDLAGQFRLEGVSPGAVVVVVEQPGFARLDHPIVLASGLARITLRLTPRPLKETVEVVAPTPRDDQAFVATRVPVPLIDVPQSVQVVDRRLLEEQQATRVGDAAANVSGVTRAIGLTDAGDRFTIRGFRTDYTLKNGFKNDALLTVTDMANVERIEVLKGPASILYGRIEPGGVVNIVTKQPTGTPHRSIQFLMNQFGGYRPTVDVGGPMNAAGSLLYRFNGSFESTASDRTDVAHRTWFFAPVIAWRPDSRTFVVAEGEFLDLGGRPDGGFPLSPVAFELPRDVNVGGEDDSIDATNRRASYTVRRRLSDSWSVTNSGSWLDISAERYQARPTGYDAFARVVERTAELTRQSSDSLFFRNDFSAEFKTGAAVHRLLFGAEVGREEYSLALGGVGMSDYDLWFPIRGRLPARPESLIARTGRKASTLSVYAQDPVAIGRWRFLTGVRLDVARIDRLDIVGDGSNAAPQPAPADPGGEPGVSPAPTPGDAGGAGPGGAAPSEGSQGERLKAFSPQFGAVFHASDTVAMFASVSRSFNPLQTEEIAPHVLNPTRGTQYEMGIRLHRGTHISATLALFQLRKSGLLRLSGIEDLVPDDDGNIVIPEEAILSGQIRSDQSGTNSSRGVEVDLSWSAWSPLTVTAAYAYLRTERDAIGPDGDTESLNSPRHSATAWATYAPGSGALRGLTVGLGAAYTSSRLVRWTTNFRIPMSHRLDAMAARVFGPARIQVNVFNLTNARYYDTDGVFGFVWPGPPRHARVSVTYEF